jgi:hypothetical protein
MRITATETDALTAVAKSKRLSYKRIWSIEILSNVNNITHRIQTAEHSGANMSKVWKEKIKTKI